MTYNTSFTFLKFAWKGILLYNILIGLNACSNKQSNAAAQDLANAAQEVYYQIALADNIRIDSSLQLCNQALAIDAENFQALSQKNILLFRLRDFDALMANIDQLRAITDKPYYLAQKALHLKLNGQEQEAQTLFNQAIAEYEAYLEEEPKLFDLWLEYAQALQQAGASEKASQIYDNLKAMDLKPEQLEILSLFRAQQAKLPESLLQDYWDGKISYDQLSQNIEDSL